MEDEILKPTNFKEKILIPIKYKRDGIEKTFHAEVDGMWDESLNDYLLDGKALRKLDAIKQSLIDGSYRHSEE